LICFPALRAKKVLIAWAPAAAEEEGVKNQPGLLDVSMKLQ